MWSILQEISHFSFLCQLKVLGHFAKNWFGNYILVAVSIILLIDDNWATSWENLPIDMWNTKVLISWPGLLELFCLHYQDYCIYFNRFELCLQNSCINLLPVCLCYSTGCLRFTSNRCYQVMLYACAPTTDRHNCIQVKWKVSKQTFA